MEIDPSPKAKALSIFDDLKDDGKLSKAKDPFSKANLMQISQVYLFKREEKGDLSAQNTKITANHTVVASPPSSNKALQVVSTQPATTTDNTFTFSTPNLANPFTSTHNSPLTSTNNYPTQHTPQSSSRHSPLSRSALLQRNNSIRKAALKKRLLLRGTEEDDEQNQNKLKNLPYKPRSSTPINHFHLLYLFMGYLQLAFNAFVVTLSIYLILQFFWTIKRDVDIKVEGEMSATLAEIAQCSRQYLENRCQPETRVPAMEKACLAWESCMARDPKVIGRAKVSAITFAEIINSFVEPISFKTMLFVSVIGATVFLVGNVVLGAARAREWKNDRALDASRLAKEDLPSSRAFTPVQLYSHGGMAAGSPSSLYFSQKP